MYIHISHMAYCTSFLVNSGVIAGVVISVLVGLIIVGGVTALIVYLKVRSRSASYLARRYIKQNIGLSVQCNNVTCVDPPIP